MNYEVFEDLPLAKKCLEAAAKTLTTFERRGPKINDILKKLAEIYFLEYDYRRSEEMVDAIL